VDTIDSKLVLLTCADDMQARRLHSHGSRRIPAPAGVPTVMLPAHPARTDIDPVLAEHDPRRVLVAGTDADLAAVLQRLLRTERLDIELAYLPVARTPAAQAWGLPHGAAALALALDGVAAAVPLVRDDSGGVLVGRGEIRGMRGECYCDDVLVLRGTAPRLVARAGRAAGRHTDDRHRRRCRPPARGPTLDLVPPHRRLAARPPLTRESGPRCARVGA
jgi:hypothetical protein